MHNAPNIYLEFLGDGQHVPETPIQSPTIWGNFLSVHKYLKHGNARYVGFVLGWGVMCRSHTTLLAWRHDPKTSFPLRKELSGKSRDASPYLWMVSLVKLLTYNTTSNLGLFELDNCYYRSRKIPNNTSDNWLR